MVFQAYVRAVTEHTERLTRLEQELHTQVQTWRLAPVVDALQALRGVQGTVAGTTVAARGDLTRFDHPQTTHGLCRADALGILPGATAPAGRDDPNRQEPCPACAGRGGLGLSGPRQSQVACTTATRNPTSS